METAQVTAAADALNARWRRVDRAVAEVGEAVNSAHPTRCPDSVAVALDALYDLWELWTSTASLSTAKADDAVRGIVEGETAAALMHARGSKTHSQVEFGDFTDTIAERVYDHYGCWRWQLHSDPSSRFAERDHWYGVHVASHEVLPPIDATVRWMRRAIPPHPSGQ